MPYSFRDLDPKFGKEGGATVPGADDFLSDLDPTRWAAPPGFPRSLRPAGMFPQDAPHGLEVVLAEAGARPSAADMRLGWSKRRAGRVSPVLLVVFHPAPDGRRVSLCGPAGDTPVIHRDIEPSQAERLTRAALAEPSRHAASRLLQNNLPELGAKVPGLRNAGLLATQELTAGVPEMPEWKSAVDRARTLLADRGRRLVEKLGYRVENLGVNTWKLTAEGRLRAVAVFCQDDEFFDAPAPRFDGATPVSKALAMADGQGADWVILTRSSEIRLYAARPDTGVGRTGRAETYVELNLALLPQDQAGYLHLLFSSEALADDGALEAILGQSTRFAAELAERLRERVYFEAVPALARAVAARLGPAPSDQELETAYQQVMVILFRLLFTAYAEDKDLLPYSTNHHYHHNSLKQTALRLLEDRRQGRLDYDQHAAALWDDVKQLWRAVDQGNTTWGVPAYDGGLFSEDPDVSPAGAALAGLSLTDAEFAPALACLLIDEGPEGDGPVDFRSLSVREFGTIYEGLLESRLVVAPDDLTFRRVKGKDMHVPVVREGDSVEVQAGEVYLYNRSGARKATGSYFTKPFAVEHLLDHALEPALENHLARLDRLRAEGDDAALAAAFFDFRCADIAMGSGHFLVAALDRIEARLSSWLALHPLPAVTNELERLRQTALNSLGELGAGVDIETGSLLRRQVARHCVYGVDLNWVAVELARLSIWVHTFVPGLPLSFLDHNLVCGNSLTGVGTLDEVVAAFEPDSDPQVPSLFRNQLEELLGRAEKSLARLARTSDANKREIDEARAAHEEAQQAVAPARALFNVLTAHRAGACPLPENYKEDTFIKFSQRERVVDTTLNWNPIHFPSSFPEVFLGEQAGFNCLIGNPPWETVKVEKQKWWGLHKPGVRSLSVGKMNAVIEAMRKCRPDLETQYQSDIEETTELASLIRRTYDLGPGDTDLYKAFAWRNWQLIRDQGTAGLVLPRTVLQAKGSGHWRKRVLKEGTFDLVTTLLNTRGWVFDDVHNQFFITLISLYKTNDADRDIGLNGPFTKSTDYQERRSKVEERIPIVEFLSWSDDASFPHIPDHPGALRLFRKLRLHPPLVIYQPTSLPAYQPTSPPAHQPTSPIIPRGWRVRPVYELHSTADKHRFVLDGGEFARIAKSTLRTTSIALSSTKGRSL